jgi:ADP-dependent NAD(P)H-hydrate dehydratase / NAD(P)H-hydrate epimerase
MHHPLDNCPAILSLAAARELEQKLFEHSEAKEWTAMRHAGEEIAAAVLQDFQEIGELPIDGHLLVLVGKGHNGGDALIAARAILEQFPRGSADIVFVFGERVLRPLAARAWRELVHAAGSRLNVIAAPAAGAAGWNVDNRRYDLCLDGIFGFQFRPPAEPRIAGMIDLVNALPIRLRAAIDLPSAGLFRADFTYATGSVKEPLLQSEAAGRIRYLDLGFFGRRPEQAVTGVTDPGLGSPSPVTSDSLVLTTGVLSPLQALRASNSDKRSYGHVFLVGGSKGYPGAIFMAVMAAVRSGAGLVTAFVPESLAPSFSARLPEAIWVGWPETPTGGLALEGEHLLRERIERANALVIGPGLGREKETLALVTQVVKGATVPVVIDADALQPEIVKAGSAARIVTPHAGEFKRIAGGADLHLFAQHPGLTVVLKGAVTKVCDGGPTYHSFFGGPVLARGGSGDLLAGMIGTQLAQTPDDPLGAAARAVVWHGTAAERLARGQGQIAVRTTQVLDYLGAALKPGRLG